MIWDALWSMWLCWHTYIIPKSWHKYITNIHHKSNRTPNSVLLIRFFFCVRNSKPVCTLLKSNPQTKNVIISTWTLGLNASDLLAFRIGFSTINYYIIKWPLETPTCLCLMYASVLLIKSNMADGLLFMIEWINEQNQII